MTLKILVVEDEIQMIKLYHALLTPTPLNPAQKKHHITEVQYVHDVWQHINNPFDLALLDLHIDSTEGIDGIDIAAELKTTNPEIVNVLVTGDPDAKTLPKPNIDILLEKGIKDFSKQLSEIVDSVETQLSGAGLEVDYWNRITISSIDSAMSGSAIRGKASHPDREEDFTASLNGVINILRREYSPMVHCTAYAGIAFARVAGYTLSTGGDDNLFSLYKQITEKNRFDTIPDFSQIDVIESRKFLYENRGLALLRIYNRLDRPLIEEISLRLDDMKKKGSKISVADRSICLACLLYSWVTGNVDIPYRGTQALREYDTIMQKHGLKVEFYPDLR